MKNYFTHIVTNVLGTAVCCLLFVLMEPVSTLTFIFGVWLAWSLFQFLVNSFNYLADSLASIIWSKEEN